jgi:hypothetical protein
MNIEKVATLRTKFMVLNNPAIYAMGGENPYAKLNDLLPKSAKYYAIVEKKDTEGHDFAYMTLRAMRRGKYPVELTCSKDEVSYDQFSPAGNVILIYV